MSNDFHPCVFRAQSTNSATACGAHRPNPTPSTAAVSATLPTGAATSAGIRMGCATRSMVSRRTTRTWILPDTLRIVPSSSSFLPLAHVGTKRATWEHDARRAPGPSAGQRASTRPVRTRDGRRMHVAVSLSNYQRRHYASISHASSCPA